MWLPGSLFEHVLSRPRVFPPLNGGGPRVNQTLWVAPKNQIMAIPRTRIVEVGQDPMTTGLRRLRYPNPSGSDFYGFNFGELVSREVA
jgi:hypothetical protein